jgi:hypothetical protein
MNHNIEPAARPLNEPASLGDIPPGDIKWVSAMSFRRDTEDSFQMNRERQAHSLRIATRKLTSRLVSVGKHPDS